MYFFTWFLKLWGIWWWMGELSTWKFVFGNVWRMGKFSLRWLNFHLGEWIFNLQFWVVIWVSEISKAVVRCVPPNSNRVEYVFHPLSIGPWCMGQWCLKHIFPLSLWSCGMTLSYGWHILSLIWFGWGSRPLIESHFNFLIKNPPPLFFNKGAITSGWLNYDNSIIRTFSYLGL